MSRGDEPRDRGPTDQRRPFLGIVGAARHEPMSRVDAARLGGLTTLQRYGNEHFREIGKLGFAATVERYGSEFAHEKAAASRAAHPERASQDEQRVMHLLAGLGQGNLLGGEPVDYQREYRVAPSTYVDFAWPGERKALEVYGGVHRVLAFDPDGGRAAREAAREERIRSAGWELLNARTWVATSDRLAAFLGVAPEDWLRHERGRRA